MAKSNRPVRSQMSGRVPSMTPKTGVFGHNPSPPFTKPQSLGRGGVPVKFTESISTTRASRLSPVQGPGVQKPFGRRGKK